MVFNMHTLYKLLIIISPFQIFLTAVDQINLFELLQCGLLILSTKKRKEENYPCAIVHTQYDKLLSNDNDNNLVIIIVLQILI